MNHLMSIKSIENKTPVALKPYGQSERNKVKATQGARPAPGAPKQRMTRKGGCGWDSQ